jgi:hypothetical protein
METTITGIVCLDMIQQVLIPQLDEHDKGRIHFQRDGAPPHYLVGGLATSFPGSYTPRFFLWGFLKDRVFVPPLPANVPELRIRITAAVAELTPEMLRSVWQDIDYRWDVCRIYQWKSHRTITIRGKTRCVLLYCAISKHCTCPLNKCIYSFKVVKLF